MTIAAFATGAAQRLPLHPRRVPARRGALSRRHRCGARGRPARRRHRRAPASPSTSSSGAAPAPTSAARRRRCSSRSRASAASRATSRRSRSRSGCSASRRRQQRRDARQRAADPRARRRRRRSRGLGTEGSTGPKLFCLSGHVARPGVYEVAFGTTLRELIELGRRRAGRPRHPDDPARRRGGRLRRTRGARHAADLRGDARRSGRRSARASIMVFDETADLVDTLRRIAAVLPRRVVRPVRPVPGRQRPPGGAAGAAGGRLAGAVRATRSWRCSREIGQAMRDASICGLGQTAIVGDRVGHPTARAGGPVSAATTSRDRRRTGAAAPIARPATGRDLHDAAGPRLATAGGPAGRGAGTGRGLTIDGVAVSGPGGVHDPRAPAAPRASTLPTLCYRENLTPVNVCRVCVVEVTGSRVLVPACSRTVEAGMEIQTDRTASGCRARWSWSSSARRSTCRSPGQREPDGDARPLGRALRRRRDALRAGRGPGPGGRARRARGRPPPRAGRRDATAAATVAQPTKVDNNLYVRDYSKCILCYKCVEACGEDAQNTFAIAVAGRGFDARISTEQAAPLPDSACVYCGNCIGVCPTGALMFKSEYDMREAGTWDESAQTVTDDDLPVLRGRLRGRSPRPGQHDRQGHLADRTRP